MEELVYGTAGGTFGDFSLAELLVLLVRLWVEGTRESLCATSSTSEEETNGFSCI
eukprot:CAMPEP_0173364226 /NCGR_PEP_ID=MMETSP1144-20121109/22854_1 /TAXON_ID=483371 /ORGANISM="non described non described, Strain CCMP2298" /LENGTH=54 /DNA_ID=CAMNT_0014314325 /DNA_START=42 /DNA_END=203 /DNA_ORIENTATION=+